MRSPGMATCSTAKARLMSRVRFSTSLSRPARSTGSDDVGDPQGMAEDPVSGKDRPAGKARGQTQLFLDAQQLVVFGDAVGAGSRPGLDLAGGGGHGEVGYEGVLGFARAVRDDRAVPRL